MAHKRNDGQSEGHGAGCDGVSWGVLRGCDLVSLFDYKIVNVRACVSLQPQHTSQTLTLVVVLCGVGNRGEDGEARAHNDVIMHEPARVGGVRIRKAENNMTAGCNSNYNRVTLGNRDRAPLQGAALVPCRYRGSGDRVGGGRSSRRRN